MGSFAKIDTTRLQRTGFPEVIYAEGKTAEHVARIFESMLQSEREAPTHSHIMATRVTKEQAQEITQLLPVRGDWAHTRRYTANHG